MSVIWCDLKPRTGEEARTILYVWPGVQISDPVRERCCRAFETCAGSRATFVGCVKRGFGVDAIFALSEEDSSSRYLPGGGIRLTLPDVDRYDPPTARWMKDWCGWSLSARLAYARHLHGSPHQPAREGEGSGEGGARGEHGGDPRRTCRGVGE